MTTTTVRLNHKTRMALLELRQGGESVDDVVQRLLRTLYAGSGSAWSDILSLGGISNSGALYDALRPRLAPAERVLADRDRDAMGTILECTGAAARWCPVHGNCSCPQLPDGTLSRTDDDCPLHGTASDHAGRKKRP